MGEALTLGVLAALGVASVALADWAWQKDKVRKAKKARAAAQARDA